MSTSRVCLAVVITALLVSVGLAEIWKADAATPESSGVTAAPSSAKLHPVLLRRLAEQPEPVKTWVFFVDKGLQSQEQIEAAVSEVAATYNPRATQRRQLRGTSARSGGPLFDLRDVPVAESYVDAVVATGARLHIRSRWLNAVSVWATRQQAEQIAALPFVDRLEAVRQSRRVDVSNVQEVDPSTTPPPEGNTRSLNYGNSTAQLSQINLINLHDAGYTGAGVIVGILDSGFRRTHQAFHNPGHDVHVVAEWDFVDNDSNTAPETGDPSSQHNHGTMILGCLAAYQPGTLIGGAFNASFVLCKTEDTTQEVPAEEDNFVAGLEFIEAHGADMSTASLGYIDWYTQAQLDGQTAVTTIACNISTGLGIHHTNAAGNEYHDTNPAVSHLIAPADAFQVITCGAVDSSGTIASFSSDGPTADGRVKPEVLARGVTTHTISPSSDTSYTTADGTSLSTPVVACALACLIQAKPYWTVDQMRARLFETSDYFVANGTFDPLYVRGYGVINAFAAYDTCSDAGVVQIDRTKYRCSDSVQILVNDCGLNLDPNVIDVAHVTVTSASEPAGEVVTLLEGAPDAAEFLGSIPISTTNAAGVLLVAPGNTVTVTYVDADDGQGHFNVPVTTTALVDCTPPNISNVHTTNVQPRSATVAFNTDEPSRGVVHYGFTCGNLNQVASGSTFSAAPTVDVAGLQDNTTYFYAVEAVDQAGNVATDNNGGNCYSFTTSDVPDFFTEQFTTGFDLANHGMSFTPNGSTDFYLACVEPITALPTDPAGGTTLSLTDDSFTAVNLSGGAQVRLYGVAYGTMYVGSNGYITFAAGDNDHTETLADHFDLPRVSGLFNDLNPTQGGGSVSWRQLTDHVAVSWLNVPRHNAGTPNTFQIELFFDGRITISYLVVSQPAALAGLSRGLGLDPNFLMSDLSALGPCETFPPTAQNVAVEVDSEASINVTLLAQDEGMPIPPGAMTFIVTSLPLHGTLTDPGAGAITTVPYTLANYGRVVRYTSAVYYAGVDTFAFRANDGGTPPSGGESNEATVTVTVLPVAHQLYTFPLNTNPGWTTQGQWAFGHPTGGGSHNRDPNNGYTGTNVYGYNLSGDYTNNMSVEQYLTTTAIDCAAASHVELRFWRRLGVEATDRARIYVSNNGTNWTQVWQNPATISDASWMFNVLDISAVADHQATVYVRWGMGPTDQSVSYPGWNIDDVAIWGWAPPTQPPVCRGDCNCNGHVGFEDIDLFVAAIPDNQANWSAKYQLFYGTLPPAGCWANCDVNGNGNVGFDDIDLFVSKIPSACPN